MRRECDIINGDNLRVYYDSLDGSIVINTDTVKHILSKKEIDTLMEYLND